MFDAWVLCDGCPTDIPMFSRFIADGDDLGPNDQSPGDTDGTNGEGESNNNDMMKKRSSITRII